MTKENNKTYRDSHSSEGYGQRYRRTYEKGYYHYQWIYLERPLIERLFKELVADGAKSYLDFACGTGRILGVAESFFNETTGVDVSESMLTEARNLCNRSSILKMDLTVDYLKETFDIITAFRFFLNAEAELRYEALKAIHSRLRDRGVFIVNIHCNKRSILGYIYRVRNRILKRNTANTEGYEEFKNLLQSNGFKIENVYWYSFLPRTGWYFEWLPKYFMKPVEKIWMKIPCLPKGIAQSFLCVCRKK